RTLHALLPHPDVARVEGDVIDGGAGAKHDHAAALDHEARYRKRGFAGMLEHDIDVALAGNVPDRLAEAARLLHPGLVFGRADFRHRAPALELAAIDHAFSAEVHDVLDFGLIR